MRATVTVRRRPSRRLNLSRSPRSPAEPPSRRDRLPAHLGQAEHEAGLSFHAFPVRLLGALGGELVAGAPGRLAAGLPVDATDHFELRLRVVALDLRQGVR